MILNTETIELLDSIVKVSEKKGLMVSITKAGLTVITDKGNSLYLCSSLFHVDADELFKIYNSVINYEKIMNNIADDCI